MNILIPDEWLRNFLKTKAKPKKIAEYLSLSGPSVEKIEKIDGTDIYHIEVTTNRVDSASVYGIAREAAAILPQFGNNAKLAEANYKPEFSFVKKVNYLDAKVDQKLCPRFTAVLIKNVKITRSPQWLSERLNWVGVRPINNVVDISNYIMHEIGQPIHTFDYDKIRGSTMLLRESKKGEKITTLDGNTYQLPGGDIVIEDGAKRLIDLAGIMGAKNSEVDEKTKNVLLFVQTYNPINIRKTSMSLPKRTEAVELFEKDLDTELVTLGIGRGIELFEKLAEAKAEKEVLNLYPNPYQGKKVTTSLDFINQRLGVTLKKSQVSTYLNSLGFTVSWSKNSLNVSVPSYRSSDIKIEEDILEEVARLYGYHELPSQLMTGALPEPITDSPFDFEKSIKDILKGYGATEVYNLSMVAEKETDRNALALKNPLGKESQYLRTSLMPSLISAAKKNSGFKKSFHLFEMANIYLPRTGKLPEEKMTIAGIFANTKYRDAKGIVESLLSELNIKPSFHLIEAKYFLPSGHVEIKSKGKILGRLGILEKKELIYYDFSVEFLKLVSVKTPTYQPLPKYPAQIEDITLTLPERTKVGEVITTIKSQDKQVSYVELTDVYKEAHTFRIMYQSPKKTLTDEEVEKIRKKVLAAVKKKHGANLKV